MAPDTLPSRNKLIVANPITPGTHYMGLNKALRLQRQKKLTISPCGGFVHFFDNALRRDLRCDVILGDLRQERGYNGAVKSGLLQRRELRSLPGIGPDAYLKLITIPIHKPSE